MTSSTARDDILARIAGAYPDRSGTVDIPRDYRRTGEHPAGAPALLDLFEGRLVDYKATVLRTMTAGLADVLSSTLDGAGRVILPPGLPESVAAAVPDATVDHGLTGIELDAFDTVLTTCAAAAAETGTIVLDGSPGQGRRAVTLVPDRHVCVVHSEQVVHSVPELLAHLDPRRPLTFISGPSATSDIELRRVEGVHGPRTLIVILVTP